MSLQFPKLRSALSGTSGAEREALELEDSRTFRLAVRSGFGARALTYALIGGIAIALAAGAGARGSTPSQEGALATVAHAPAGGAVLALVAVGLAAYALWKFTLAAVGTGPEGARGTSAWDRLSNLAGGIVYLSFTVLAVEVLFGSAGNQSREQQQATAGVLGWPGGRVLVAIAGVVLVIICAQQAYVGARARFASDSKTQEMGPVERRTFLWLGRVGIVARSAVFALSGYFLIRTAITAHVSRGISLDGTLAEVHAQPFGAVLLALVGAGLLTFAAFSLLEARRRRL